MAGLKVELDWDTADSIAVQVMVHSLKSLRKSIGKDKQHPEDFLRDMEVAGAMLIVLEYFTTKEDYKKLMKEITDA